MRKELCFQIGLVGRIEINSGDDVKKEVCEVFGESLGITNFLTSYTYKGLERVFVLFVFHL